MKVTKTIVRTHITKLGYNPNWTSKEKGDSLLDRVLARLVDDFPREIIDKAHTEIQRENACPSKDHTLRDF